MKSKKKTYILLLMVLIIWGVLGYRIYSAVSPKENPTPLLSDVVFKPTPIAESNIFTIKANYKDPFLDSRSTKKSKVKQKATTNRVTQKQPKLPFPTITYKGLVSGENKKQVFIININGKQYFFKKSQTHQEVKIISGNTKQVTLQFQGQRQTVSIEK